MGINTQDPQKNDCPTVKVGLSKIGEPTLEDVHLADIRRARTKLRLAQLEQETALAEAKAAKLRMEAAQRELNRIIDAVPERQPLIDGTEPASDDWESTPIERLALGPAIDSALHEYGVYTIGLIADWTAADRRLTDINGIGEAEAERIEQALDIFWKERNDNLANPGKDVAL
ncbi:MAG: hypothetical protein Kow0040_22840 [Thermogutta sp.]